MKKYFKLITMLLAISIIFSKAIIVNAEENTTTNIITNIIENIDIQEYTNELEFLNSITDKLHLNTGYTDIKSFKEYADNNYSEINPYHMEGTTRVSNYNLISLNKNIVIIIATDQVYLVKSLDNSSDEYLNVCTVGQKYSSSDMKIKYNELMKELNIHIYEIDKKSLPMNTELKINDSYGYRTDPINGTTKFHSGIDLDADMRTELYATETGTVKTAELGTTGYGNYIEITYKNGYSALYAHCDELLVSEGQTVYAGDLIAYSGQSGRVTGPHLHFEYMYNDETLDPWDYLNRRN